MGVAEDDWPPLIPVGLQGVASRSAGQMKGPGTVLLRALGGGGAPVVTEETPETSPVLLDDYPHCLVNDEAVHGQGATHVSPDLRLRQSDRDTPRDT